MTRRASDQPARAAATVLLLTFVALQASGLFHFETPTVVYSGCTSASGMVVLELNGDGRPDIVAACNVGGRALYAFYNNITKPGVISFIGPVVLASVPTVGESTLAIGYLNGDNTPDLVYSFEDKLRAITVYPNASIPTSMWNFTKSGARILAIACGDVDNDGFDEVASTAASPGYVGVHYNYRNGSFSSEFVLISGAYAPTHFVSATFFDINFDGFLDLTIALETPQYIVALYSNGTVITEADRQIIESLEGPSFTRHYFAELNSNTGQWALIAAAGNQDARYSVVVGPNLMGGWYTISSISNANALAYGDVDYDGVLDFMVSYGASNPWQMEAYRLDVGGTWGGVYAGLISDDLTQIVTGSDMQHDFDGDGFLDLATVHHFSAHFKLTRVFPTCVVPAAPLNTTHTAAPATTVSFGFVFNASCPVGFVLVGPASRSCGRYNGSFVPAYDSWCTQACGALPPLLNGTLSPSTDFFSGVTRIARCNSGFYLVGNSSRTCAGGLWSGGPQSCARVACPAGPDPSDSTLVITAAGLYGDVRSGADVVTCTGNALLWGPATATCDASGRWVHTTVCLPAVSRAPEITRFALTANSRDFVGKFTLPSNTASTYSELIVTVNSTAPGGVGILLGAAYDAWPSARNATASVTLRPQSGVLLIGISADSKTALPVTGSVNVEAVAIAAAPATASDKADALPATGAGSSWAILLYITGALLLWLLIGALILRRRAALEYAAHPKAYVFLPLPVFILDAHSLVGLVAPPQESTLGRPARAVMLLVGLLVQLTVHVIMALVQRGSYGRTGGSSLSKERLASTALSAMVGATLSILFGTGLLRRFFTGAHGRRLFGVFIAAAMVIALLCVVIGVLLIVGSLVMGVRIDPSVLAGAFASSQALTWCLGEPLNAAAVYLILGHTHVRIGPTTSASTVNVMVDGTADAAGDKLLDSGTALHSASEESTAAAPTSAP